MNTPTFLRDPQMITKEDEEIPTPEIARPQITHEILFAIGGCSEGNDTNFAETYDIRADRWVEVSCTQIYLYRALLNNACKKKSFFFFSFYFYHSVGFLYTFI
jgi:hypothetical protein